MVTAPVTQAQEVVAIARTRKNKRLASRAIHGEYRDYLVR